MRHLPIVLTLCLALMQFETSAQNERMLLIESFTNSGCENCAQQNPELDELIASNSDRVAAIQYHVNWPSDSDPMYLRNPTDNETRTAYYEVTGVPHVVVDGNHFSGTPNQLNQNIIDLLLTQESPLEMQVDFEVDQDVHTLYTHVTGQSAMAFSNLRLFVGTIEKNVHFDAAPGPYGECDYFNVMYRLLPDASGQTIEYLASNEPFDYRYTCPLDHFYDPEQLDVIAWIQASNGSKTVLQACKAKGHHGFDENDHNTACIYPNPTTGQIFIKTPIPQKVSIFNLKGQCVFESRCLDTIQLNLRDFGTGLFFIKVGSHIQKINII